MTNLVGQALGKYHLVAPLGRGGMAEVYKAYQPGLNRYVAIKVLHSHMAEDKDFIGRFEREANAVARLRHPNILQVYDFDSEGDRHYMVMEFVEGPTLKAELQERNATGRGFTLEEAARIFSPLAHAIDYAHARGMVHRDLKPANIMFSAEGQVVLTDFGIALMVGGARFTLTGAITGTPVYMAPEQGEGRPGDARTDIYALGVIVYEMLTRRVPFDADTAIAIIMQHLNNPPPSPAAINPDLPEAVAQVLLKALNKNPDDRCQSAGEMDKALRDALGLTTEQMLSTLPGLSFTPVAASETFAPGDVPPNPYRGLAAFREEDAPFFFGREDFAVRLVEAMRNQPLVAVIGPSGSGKSSSVFAGLLPRLRPTPPAGGTGTLRPTQRPTPPVPGITPGSTPRPTTGKTWVIADFRPGRQPFHALADALVPLLEPQLSETDRMVETRKLADVLHRGDLGLPDVAHRILQKTAGGAPADTTPHQFLLVADQFHELYTLCPDLDLRRRFLDVLLQAVEPPSTQTPTSTLTLLLTLRDDFLGQALAHRPLADAFQAASLPLGPMTRPELRRAIEAPAARQNVQFEPGLVERILDDVGAQAGASATSPGQSLPLLEFALTALWEHQRRRQMTHATYDEIGRVEGALARHADEIYDKLGEAEKELARRVFVQLVRPGEGTGDTRRLATRAELGEAGWELAQRLADARLVVTSRDATTGQETAEIIHDALIRSWGPLREWMEAQRPFRAWQERLRAALRQWDANSLNESALLYGAPLAEAEGWLAEREADLSPAEKAYIFAGLTLRARAEAEREAQRQRELEAAQKLVEAEKQRAEEQARAVEAAQRLVEAAQKLAETERRRAEAQARANRRLKWMVVGLSLVSLIALIVAGFALQQRFP